MIKSKFKEEDFSFIKRNRTELFGIATLWIMLFHSAQLFPKDSSILKYFINYIQQTGHFGVDIFVLLSGFGLFFSLKKTFNIKEFYIKRILRVYIPYLTIITLYTLLNYNNFTAIEFLKRITTYNFWIENNCELWYIPVIMTYYCVYPYIYISQKNGKCSNIILLICITCAISIICHNTDRMSSINMLLGRFPIFIVGSYIAEHINDKINIFQESIIIILGIICYILYGSISAQSNILYTYYIITIPIVFCIIFLYNIIDNKVLSNILKFIGIYSLEVYLLYQHITYPLICNICTVFSNNLILTTMTSAISTIFVAVIIKEINNSIIKLIKYYKYV